MRTATVIPLHSRLSDASVQRLPASIGRADLHLGDVTVEAHVLDNTDRVLTLRTAVFALTGKQHGNLGEIVEVAALKSLLDADLILGETREFAVPGSPFRGKGLAADAFIDICQGYVRAFERGTLRTRAQQAIAKRCCVLVAACAKVGLIALIDEKTGFQQYRKADELETRLRAYLQEHPRDWLKTFPDELWRQLGRLTGYAGPVDKHRPKWWGKVVNEVIYQALDPAIARKLKTKPSPDVGPNYHQYFTEILGLPALRVHLDRVVGIAMCCADLVELRDRVAIAFRTREVQLPLPFRRAA